MSPSCRKHNHNRANKWKQSQTAAEVYSQKKLGNNSDLITSHKVSTNSNCSATFDSGHPTSKELAFLTHENFHQLEDFVDQSGDLCDMNKCSIFLLRPYLEMKCTSIKYISEQEHAFGLNNILFCTKRYKKQLGKRSSLCEAFSH